MKRTKLAAFTFWAATLALPAHATTLFVSPQTGSDSNNCEHPGAACRTLARACDLSPQGRNTLINLANGVYTAAHCDIQHFRFVAVLGNAEKPSKVILEAPSGNIFAVQDHATLILKGVTLRTSSGGGGPWGY